MKCSHFERLQLRRIRCDPAAFDDPMVLMGDLTMPGPRPAKQTGYRSPADHPTFPVVESVRRLDHILVREESGKVHGQPRPC